MSDFLSETLSLSESVASNEHREALLRLKRCYIVGLLLWPLYTPLDFLVGAHGVSLKALLIVRITVQAALLLLFLILVLTRVSPLALIVVEILGFSAVSTGLGLHALLGPGFEAATFTSTFLVLVVHGLVQPCHWHTGIWKTAPSALLPPLFLGICYLSRPELLARFDDPVLQAEFLSYVGSYFAVWSVVLYAGHITWSLRRQLHENKLIGRYRLIERIGKGGMGEVWRAWHPTLRTEVALKLTTRSGETELVRFEREINALTSIVHPGVVKIFDCGVTEEGFIFYTMELLNGRSLRQRLDDRTVPLTRPEVAAIVIDVAGALAAAHHKGIVHRDIKPENILLVPTPAGVQAKLIDFGVASWAKNQAGVDDTGALTEDGAILGTPVYLAPEQALGQEVDARADIYALGAVLFTCLVGRPPFVEPSLTAMLLAHAQKQPPPPSLMVPGLSPAVDEVVLKALQKKPRDRYASVEEFAEAVRVAFKDSAAVGVARFTAVDHEAPTVDG